MKRIHALMYVGIIVAVLILLLQFLTKKKQDQIFTEGFETVPSATQSSSIPHDMPGATTANPTFAELDDKDYVDMIDTIKLYIDIYNPALFTKDMTDQKRNSYVKAFTEADGAIKILERSRANPTQYPVPERMIQAFREYKTLVNELRQLVPKTASDREILQQKINEFNELYKKSNVTLIEMPREKALVKNLNLQSNTLLKNLKSFKNDPNFLASIRPLTESYLKGIEVLKAIPIPPPTTTAGPSNVITLEELKSLLVAVEKETLRLTNLRSTAPTIKIRVDQLTKLGADIREYINKVERRQIRLEDVPITPEDAKRFLEQIKAGEEAIPTVITPAGTTPELLKPSSASEVPPIVPTSPMNQAIFSALQTLKWKFEINVEHDPVVAQRERIMKRIEDIEKRILSYSYSETPIPADVQKLLYYELRALGGMLAEKNNSDSYRERIESYNSRMEPGSNSVEYPSSESLTKVANDDWKVRPGFEMNDDQIQRRASASAFDPSTVGGLDYKERTLQICKQIRSANLGDPSNFGCVTNENEVSSAYSWKGAYQMVCNRLGDTWGSWYPEMFGCPKYNPSARYSGAMIA